MFGYIRVFYGLLWYMCVIRTVGWLEERISVEEAPKAFDRARSADAKLPNTGEHIRVWGLGFRVS